MSEVSAKEIKDKTDKKLYATVDTEFLFMKFSETSQIREKVMKDYNDFLNKNKNLKDISPEEKSNKSTEELNKILTHYSTQIVKVITNEINSLIKEKSLSIVINKNTFSTNKRIFTPEIQRINNVSEETIDKRSTKKEQQTQKDPFEDAIIYSSFDFIDLTNEVLARIEKQKANIKLLPYGRSIK